MVLQIENRIKIKKMNLKHLLLLLFVGLMSFSFSNYAGDKFPSVMVKTMDGHSADVNDFIIDGKITVVSFWATWCSPCKRELDAIADLYPDWQEYYNVEFLAITTDNARGFAKVPAMVASKGWEYTILSDSKQELQNALNFQAIPQTFLIDQNGNVVYSHSGYNPGDEYELEDKIKALSK